MNKICDICGEQAGKTDSSMKNHLLRRHGGGAFNCSQCGQSFTTKEMLNTHEKLHTDSFSRDKCNSVFNKKSNLKRHKATHE